MQLNLAGTLIGLSALVRNQKKAYFVLSLSRSSAPDSRVSVIVQVRVRVLLGPRWGARHEDSGGRLMSGTGLESTVPGRGRAWWLCNSVEQTVLPCVHEGLKTGLFI